jgi:hypothetical protein
MAESPVKRPFSRANGDRGGCITSGLAVRFLTLRFFDPIRLVRMVNEMVS